MSIWLRFRAVALLLPLLLLAARGAAQQTVSGVVVDALSGETLPTVQVTAHLVADSSSMLAGGVSNRSGRFLLAELRPGSYRIAFRLLGYTPLERTVTIPSSAAPGTLDLGRIQMSAEAIIIDEVTVTAAPDAVVYAPDRDIYSVDAMPAAAGGTATDALGQVPDLEVDINGEVTLRGNAPTIYINGRPAPMRGESIAFFIQQIPA